ncbi:MAG: single-stranded-DNA-specific exonuclease RecJ [Chlamydiota bacterium]
MRASKAPLWIYPSSIEGSVTLSQEYGLPPLIAELLLARGLKSKEQVHSYLYGQLPDLLPPEIFPDMDKAVKRILQAAAHKEAILIYGDNDVDGMTATALLTDFLGLLDIPIYYYVPNRSALKQSLILHALEFALEKGCKIIITVDCGITAAKEIAEVAAHNIDVIITDHHEPTAKLPHCLATLNPKLLNSPYPNREITGVGVAFKLAHALTNALSAAGSPKAPLIDLKSYLDLVALGTIADMGSLLGENRILVRYGLQQLRATQRVGLIKLLALCHVEKGDLTSNDIASKIAPRLNSLGRVAEPRKGVELLLIKDPVKAESLAKELDLFNTTRQKIEQSVTLDVEKMLKKNPSLTTEKAIILSSSQWHSGVIAIVSTKICKRYNRPAIIIAVDKGIGKGSGRTIREYPLLPALKECSDLLLNFGGHDYAAGLTILEENIPAFITRFQAITRENLPLDDLISKTQIDGRADFKDLSFEFMELLALLEPYGNDNPPPLFYTDVRQGWPAKIVGKSHVKFYLEQKDRFLEGIGFGMGERLPELLKKKQPLRILFTPMINKFHHKPNIQLHIKDFTVL